jgi:hypothetical protein
LLRPTEIAIVVVLPLVGVAGGACAHSSDAHVPVQTAATPSASGHSGASADAPEGGRTMTVLVTSAQETDYCDGEKMDSDGFRKTLTVAKPITLPPSDASDSERVVAVIDAATDGMCQTVMRQLNYRIDQGTLHVPPVEGWAGVSIVMCWCRPQLEVNLVRLPGVDRVVWDEQQP